MMQPNDPQRLHPVPHSPPASVGPYSPRAAFGSSPAPGGGEAGGGGVPWARYLEALKRSWWIVLLCAAIGTTGGYIFSMAQRPTFMVEAKIWVKQPPRGTDQLTTPTALLGPSAWTPLMQSFAVVDPIVKQFRTAASFPNPADSLFNKALELDTAYRAGDYELKIDETGKKWELRRSVNGRYVSSLTGAAGDSIAPRWGFKWAPPAWAYTPNRTVVARITDPRTAARWFIRGVRPMPTDLEGNFLMVSMEATNNRRAATILNAFLRQFVAKAAEFKKARLVDLRQNVADQAATAYRALRESETALEKFKVQTITQPGEDVAIAAGLTVTTSPVFAQFFAAKSQYEEARRNRDRLEKLLSEYSQRNEPIPIQVFLTQLPTVFANNPQLKAQYDDISKLKAELKGQQQVFTDSTEQVQGVRREIAQAEAAVPVIVRGIIDQLKDIESQFKASIDNQSNELQQIPQRVIEEGRLKRAVDANSMVYNTLAAKLEQVKLQEAEAYPDLEVLDTAEAPIAPASNPGGKTRMIGIAFGILVGLGLAILRDLLDKRFRYPEQATVDMGLTIAGTVPKFRANRRGELSVTAMSQVIESFRTLRLGVRHHFLPEQPVVVCITSPGPGEGKSLVSSNLAIAFANAGQRTLLIDGDVRRGVVHTTFDVKRRPGLVDYLSGSADISEVIRQTSTANLSVIPSGSRNRKAPELLVSERMTELVVAMRDQFEVVLIDSPPFSAGMDSFALGTAAGSVLLVLRPGVTDRKLAQMKLEVLDRLPVGVIGAVLNGIAGSGAYRYYYSDYGEYTQEVIDEDGAEDEADEPIQVPTAAPPRLVKKT